MRTISVGNGCPNTLCYTYDADGKRIRKRISSTITDYIYDAGGTLVAERQSTNGGSSWTWVKGYVSFAGQMLAQYNGVLGAGGATTYFAHKDHLGSTRVLTTYNGSPHQTFDYLPFGEPLTPPTPASPTTSNQFTGQLRDPESGLDFFNARYFSSLQGRFTSPDPLMASGRIGDPQSWNRYSYVLNRPLRLVDPTGLALEYPDDLDTLEENQDALEEGQQQQQQISERQKEIIIQFQPPSCELRPRPPKNQGPTIRAATQQDTDSAQLKITLRPGTTLENIGASIGCLAGASPEAARAPGPNPAPTEATETGGQGRMEGQREVWQPGSDGRQRVINPQGANSGKIERAAGAAVLFGNLGACLAEVWKPPARK